MTTQKMFNLVNISTDASVNYNDFDIAERTVRNMSRDALIEVCLYSMHQLNHIKAICKNTITLDIDK